MITFFFSVFKSAKLKSVPFLLKARVSPHNECRSLGQLRLLRIQLEVFLIFSTDEVTFTHVTVRHGTPLRTNTHQGAHWSFISEFPDFSLTLPWLQIKFPRLIKSRNMMCGIRNCE